jgi:hypothetical protein
MMSANTPFKKNTAHATMELRLLKEDLQRVVQEGYAFDDQQYSIGVRCLDAPLFIMKLSSWCDQYRRPYIHNNVRRQDRFFRGITVAAFYAFRRIGHGGF